MSDSIDIQNILQSGYFTTSRARTTAQSSPPHSPSLPSPILPSFLNGSSRTTQRAPYSRAAYPPAPSVEDESQSLLREHGTAKDSFPHEEAQSRGEIDQNPMMLEVHEFNPERRFVLVPFSTDSSSTSAEDKPKVDNVPRVKKSLESLSDQSQTARERSPESDCGEQKPPLPRRKSRQDLPPLETDVGSAAASKRHSRTKSATGTVEVDTGSGTQSRAPRDDLLSPDVTKYGSSRRDKAYYGYGQSANDTRSSSQRNSPTTARERYHEGKPEPRRSSPSTSKRSSSTVEPDNQRRQASPDKLRGSHSADARRTAPAYSQDPSTWEGRRFDDERPQDPQGASLRGRKSTIIQDDIRPSSAGRGMADESGIGSRARVQTVPVPSPSMSTFTDTPLRPPRSSATFPIRSNAHVSEESKPQLPYPEDDPFLMPVIEAGLRSDIPAPVRSKTPLPVPPHGVPLVMPDASGRPLNNVSTSALPVTDFDPNKHVALANKSAGAYRRCAESKEKSGRFPECPRAKPVQGMMDWLTLPHTNFNICPTCYLAVFANSDFRTHFKPMLRPTIEPIACDFGATPWYRIAWLLTLRNKRDDLLLLHHVESLTAATAKEPCPGPKRATRPWLTVKDPYTRKAVPGFFVCRQCARLVEGLLPNLNGLFIPTTSSKSETSRNLCALHFTPDRRRFVLYFDALEVTSFKALDTRRSPDIDALARELGSLSVPTTCSEDNPVINGYWHLMHFLPQFTVCEECFEEVVHPRLEEENVLARNFYTKPQRLPQSITCQLYSARMREVFKRACMLNDPAYLESKAMERVRKELEIHDKLVRLDREQNDHEWTKKRVDELIREWQRWE